MLDHTTATASVNRFEGILDGTPATAQHFVSCVLAMGPAEGLVELPSGRRVATYDPEYLDWLFAAAWRTPRKAAAWLGVPEPLFVAACAAVAKSVHTEYVWQERMLAAATLEQCPGQSPETYSAVRAGVVRLFGLTGCNGMHIVAQINIRNAVARARPPVQSTEPHTFVYFLRSGRRVKIGRSSNPKRRVFGIAAQVGTKMTLAAAIPARWEDETSAHTIFAATRQSGEWFAASPELRALVALAKKDPAEALRVIRMPPAEALSFLADIAAPRATQLRLVANENGSKKAG